VGLLGPFSSALFCSLSTCSPTKKSDTNEEKNQKASFTTTGWTRNAKNRLPVCHSKLETYSKTIVEQNSTVDHLCAKRVPKTGHWKARIGRVDMATSLLLSSVNVANDVLLIKNMLLGVKISLFGTFHGKSIFENCLLHRSNLN
jgi:hypothetical protein